MISSYGDQSTTRGTILHIIIIVLHQRCLNCSECFQRHLMFYTCNYNIRVTLWKWCYTYFLHESDPRRDHQQIVLYSFCRSMRLLFTAVVITQIFLYEDLSTWVYIHLSVVFPSRMPAGPHFVTQPILLSENIPNIDKIINKTQGGQTRLKR